VPERRSADPLERSLDDLDVRVPESARKLLREQHIDHLVLSNNGSDTTRAAMFALLNRLWSEPE
jgi:hypothetical protein